jgi:hypothetical protein
MYVHVYRHCAFIQVDTMVVRNITCNYYVYIYRYTHAYTYINLYACTSFLMYVSMYTNRNCCFCCKCLAGERIYILIYVYIYIYTYHVYIHICICVYTYTYVYLIHEFASMNKCCCFCCKCLPTINPEAGQEEKDINIDIKRYSLIHVDIYIYLLVCHTSTYRCCYFCCKCLPTINPDAGQEEKEHIYI